ncbi:right-handed parallel beta-helix repeat-containing protein [candidate division KSB1 bacterium]|nr:right-handed parallel beta-helix repeat-containing protein [candidate division KSB1 bacterium]
MDLKKIICMVIGLLWITHAGATTYYVSPQGNDEYTKTEAQSLTTPWKTIFKATHSVVAGDSIVLADGEYSEANITFGSSGTAMAWITLTAAPGAKPRITRTALTKGIYLYKSNYIHLNGLTLHGFDVDGIAIYYCDYIICSNIHAYDNGNAGINVIDSDHIIIQDSELHHNGWKSTGDSGWGDGASINNHDAVGKMSVFRRNVCYANWQKRAGAYWDGNGFTLDCVGTDGLHIVANNIFFNNGGTGVLVGATENIKVLHNVFYRNKADVNCRNKAELYLIKDQTHNTILKNNIIYSRPGVWTIDRYDGPDNDVIGNNLIWGEDGPQTQIWWLALKRIPMASWIQQRAPQTLGAQPVFMAAPQDDQLTQFHNSTWIDMDLKNYNFQLPANSNGIDAGLPLTVTISAGSGNKITVENAGYFIDGFGIVDGDYIKIGANPVVKVLQVDYPSNSLVVEPVADLRWNKGDGVSYAYTGQAPDLGAREYNLGQPPTSSVRLDQLPSRAAQRIEVTVTTSKTVIKNPSPLYLVESDASFIRISLEGKVPGNTFSGKLQLNQTVAEGRGYFLLTHHALVDELGFCGHTIIEGRQVQIDRMSPSVPSNVRFQK